MVRLVALVCTVLLVAGATAQRTAPLPSSTQPPRESRFWSFVDPAVWLPAWFKTNQPHLPSTTLPNDLESSFPMMSTTPMTSGEFETSSEEVEASSEEPKDVEETTITMSSAPVVLVGGSFTVPEESEHFPENTPESAPATLLAPSSDESEVSLEESLETPEPEVTMSSAPHNSKYPETPMTTVPHSPENSPQTPLSTVPLAPVGGSVSVPEQLKTIHSTPMTNSFEEEEEESVETPLVITSTPISYRHTYSSYPNTLPTTRSLLTHTPLTKVHQYTTTYMTLPEAPTPTTAEKVTISRHLRTKGAPLSLLTKPHVPATEKPVSTMTMSPIPITSPVFEYGY